MHDHATLYPYLWPYLYNSRNLTATCLLNRQEAEIDDEYLDEIEEEEEEAPEERQPIREREQISASSSSSSSQETAAT